jgi:hypothetical protein
LQTVVVVALHRIRIERVGMMKVGGGTKNCCTTSIHLFYSLLFCIQHKQQVETINMSKKSQNNSPLTAMIHT